MVKQIIKAVPIIYIEGLKDPITKFAKLVPYTLLNISHRWVQCSFWSRFRHQSNTHKDKVYSTYFYWSTFRQLRKVKQFEKKTGEEIQNSTLCRTCYNDLHVTELFLQPYYEWRILKTDTVKAWNKYQPKFIQSLGIGKIALLLHRIYVIIL